MKMLLSFLAMLCLFGLVSAQEPVQPPKPVYKPTIGDYEDVLTKLTKWSDNFNKDEFWKDTKLKNKESGKVVDYKDLPRYEKDVFVFMTAEKLTNELKRFDNVWHEELKKFKDDKKAENKNKGKEKVAEKADVENYLGQLATLRKVTAKRFEDTAEKLFKTYKDKFSEEERDKYMKEIRDFHDKEKLIERKK